MAMLAAQEQGIFIWDFLKVFRRVTDLQLPKEQTIVIQKNE